MQTVLPESMATHKVDSVQRLGNVGWIVMRNAASRSPLCFLIYLLLAGFTPVLGQYQTLGPGSCGLSQNNCHTSENNWWKDDAHKTTVDAFYDDPESYEKIARLSGVGVDNMFKGNQLCMTCHGTVVSGRESREVDEGVSCESCHGPGSGYKDPHQEGDPKDGVNRVGYQKALKLGLMELKNLNTRGQTCVRCHYITDQKLLAAGHPDGARFNYVSGIKKVAKHWKHAPGEEELSKAPFAAAMDAKGPIAQITKVAAIEEKTEPDPQPAAANAKVTESLTNAPVAAAVPPVPPSNTSELENAMQSGAEAMNTASLQPATKRPSPTRPVRSARVSAAAPELMNAMAMAPAAPDTAIIRVIELPPFPQLSDTMSVEQVLLIIKARVKMLYDKTRR